METGKAQRLYESYSGAMACIEVRNKQGDLRVGSAFHVGEGVFVTAKHVVENKVVLQVVMTQRTRVTLTGDAALTAKAYVHIGDTVYPSHYVENGSLTLSRGPFLHPDEAADVAVFQVENIDPLTPIVELGQHLDDWLDGDDFVLSEAIVLGYPPIPLTKRPILVAVRAEVSAMVNLVRGRSPSFIISSMARGGFSGGVVISDMGFVLGMVTESLVKDDQPAELGFMATTSIEPIYDCLARFKLLPEIQGEWSDDLFNRESVDIHSNTAEDDLVLGHVTLFDNGRRGYVTIAFHYDETILLDAVEVFRVALGDVSLQTTKPHGTAIRLTPTDSWSGPLSRRLEVAGNAVLSFAREKGFRTSEMQLPPSDLADRAK